MYKKGQPFWIAIDEFDRVIGSIGTRINDDGKLFLSRLYVKFDLKRQGRCAWLESIEMPFSLLEENNITIPVLGVNCDYKYHVTFGDTIIIIPFVKEYSGVRMTVGYDIKDKKTGKIVLVGETKHCFTNKDLRPINLKKQAKEFSDKFQDLLENK